MALFGKKDKQLSKSYQSELPPSLSAADLAAASRLMDQWDAPWSGPASVSFIAVGNTTVQLTTLPTMRGRVMALQAVAFLGSTPVGGPIAGWVSRYGGGRAGLVLGHSACLLAARLGLAARLVVCLRIG